MRSHAKNEAGGNGEIKGVRRVRTSFFLCLFIFEGVPAGEG